MKKNIRPIALCIVFMFLIILFSDCTQKQESEELQSIDLVAAYQNKQNIKLSKFIKSVEYVTLSSKDSLVGKASNIFVDDENIVVIAFKQQYLFDRETGNFIRIIGEFDRGPEGYRFTKSNLAYNESRKSIYSGGWNRNILEYSLDGKITQSFDKPCGPSMYGAFTWLNDSVHVAYYSNFSGDDTAKIIFINRNANKVSEFITIDQFEKNPKFFRSWGGDKEGWFYRFNSDLFFKELFNDTIFQLKYQEVIPRYNFLSGDYTPPSLRRNFFSNEAMQNFHFLEKIFETKDFLFFSLNFKNELRCGLFDKNRNEVLISDAEKPDKYFYNLPYFGFINDIDNFIQFCPHYMNENKEIVASVDAYEVVNWFKENPEKAAKLPPNLQKLKNMKETDNPVVMIAKLKE